MTRVLRMRRNGNRNVFNDRENVSAITSVPRVDIDPAVSGIRVTHEVGFDCNAKKLICVNYNRPT